MRNINRFAATLGLALFAAQAQAVQFDFLPGVGTLTSNNGNTFSAEVAGLTVTASAWSSAAGNAFQAGELNLTTAGLGVYSAGEVRNASGADALGNRTAKGVDTSDLVLFSFSAAVSLQSLNLSQTGSDSDLSLWAGTGTGPANPIGLLQFDNTLASSGGRTVALSAFSGTYDWLAVAARIGQKDDLVRLQSLMVTPVTQPVPDAATWMTMLAGLGLVGFAVKRRTRV